jgi:hypothetical protein
VEVFVSRVHWACGVAGLLLVVLAGCGDSLDLLPASGTVTYNGQPVDGADVIFTPDNGQPGTGKTDASGKYTISTMGKPGATRGMNKVTIQKTSRSGEAIANPKPEDMMKMQKGPSASTVKSELPDKYSVPQGGLTADVQSGTASFDFTLTD